MPRVAEHAHWRGLGVMTGLLAALVAFAAWQAMHRTARVDDALSTNTSGNATRWPDMRININTATASELALLPGVGERLGQRIVDDRAANGPFATLDDLNRVPGLGAATIERLRPYALVE